MEGRDLRIWPRHKWRSCARRADLAPREGGIVMYRHILIPTDGSSYAHHAVEHGLALAKTVGAQVTFLAVEPKFDFLSVLPAVPDPLAEEFVALGKQTK